MRNRRIISLIARSLSALTIALGLASSTAIAQVGTLETVPYGTKCQKIRASSPSMNEQGGNDVVVYCPDAFPLVMHCGTLAKNAPLGKTVMSTTNSACTATGKCSGMKTRKSFGPQNQSTEIVQKSPDSATAQAVMGCWVYDLDHLHLPYIAEVVCCQP